MVNVYIRRKKKFGIFYKRRRRGVGKQGPSPPLSSEGIVSFKEEVQNNGLFSSANDFIDTGFIGGLPLLCISEKNRENSEVEFDCDATVTTRQPENNVVLNTGGSLHEDVLTEAKIPIGIGLINNEPLLSVIQQLTSTLRIQRRPRSARKSTSLASRRRSIIECSASDYSKQMASHLGASTSICCEIIPKTLIKEGKISKFAPQSLLCNVQDLLSTGVLTGALVKYMKDNLELQGIVTTSGICCGCSLCNFEQVVSSLKFEKHAGSKSNNQNAHIFLENGKSLYALSKELTNVYLGSLGEVIEEKFGYPANMVYKAGKESLNAVGIESSTIRKISRISLHDKIHLKKNKLDENITMAYIKSWHGADKGNPKMHHNKGISTNQQHFPDLLHELQANLIFPKGPRSTRAERPPPSLISKVNQKVSRQLIFCDVDPQHCPAHKKRGVDIISSKELSLKESSEITSEDLYQSKIGQFISPKKKLSCMHICKNNAKLSSEYTPDSALSTVSGLLATCVLEGLPVNYKKDEIELLGFIKDLGICCGCSSCRFSKVLSLFNFEKHGGASSMNPDDCIFVNDKITLYALVKELGNIPLGLLSCEVIQKMIGCQPNILRFLSWKESFYKKMINFQSTSCNGGKNQLAHVFLHSRPSPAERLMPSASEDNLPLPSGNDVKLNLSGQAEKTMKHREQDFHQQIFDLLNDGYKLSYRSHGKEVLAGYKFGKNILCCCCNFMVSASKFEAHAGHEKKRKPYHSIYTSYGKSLHQIAMFLLLDTNSFVPSIKDLIMTYKSGGDSALFSRYQNGYNAGEQSPGACSPFSFRLGHVFLAPCNLGSCMLCSDGDATLNFGNICDSTILFCGQCGRMFHVGCLRHHGICDIKTRPSPPDIWLCSNKCKKVRADLLDFVQGGPRTIPESLLNSSSSSIESTSHEESNIDVHWELLSGRFQGDKSKLLLQQATAIFQEAFDAVYKGHRDVLSIMVNGEKGVAEFFGGMFCAVITIKSVIVSAALLRVFDNHVAELPLAVTPKERRGEGYFKILFLKIEEMLSFMKVDNLILPADDHSLPMWVEKFGFINLSMNEIQEYQMKHRIVMFEKTTMLQKAVLPP